jgi:hypothetical protein
VSVPARRPLELWSNSIEGIDGVQVEQAVVTRGLKMATELLWMLSGRQFGYTTMTIRPCRRSHRPQSLAQRYYEASRWPYGLVDWPAWWAHDPFCNVCGTRSCGCTELEEYRLPRRPVVDVPEVKVDGVIVPDEVYHVDGWRYLVRTDGERWPLCQDLALPTTEVGTWSITYKYGREIPELGVYSCEKLAREFVLDCIGLECALPDRLQSISRQGVSMAFLDPMDFIDKGRTGITIIDHFLHAVNPHGLQRRARVYRADTAPAARISRT